MTRHEQGLQFALKKIPEIREEFWRNLLVPGTGNDLNQSLERAGRVADFLEFAELMVIDALTRKESCGCHFREESQTADQEAQRDDENFSHVSVWQRDANRGGYKEYREPLQFHEVQPSLRSYK